MEPLPEYGSELLQDFESKEAFYHNHFNCTSLSWNDSFEFNETHPCAWNASIDDFGEFLGGPPLWIHVFVQILYGTVFLTGLCGNTLVIYVVVRFAKMQTVTK